MTEYCSQYKIKQFVCCFCWDYRHRITPPATRKERVARHQALKQQGMQVGGFAKTFWTFPVGLN